MTQGQVSEQGCSGSGTAAELLSSAWSVWKLSGVTQDPGTAAPARVCHGDKQALVCFVQQLWNNGDPEWIPLSFGQCRQHLLPKADILKGNKSPMLGGVLDCNQGFEAPEM